MIMESNPQIELAFDYVSLTNKNIFLTGKAGTGKTTFLRRVRREVIKRMAVVAPTGVAAINAEGVTIHSLFQLPFGPLVPGQVEAQIGKRRFNRDKISLIKSLDLLIIDEISMVRADVLDAIDTVLRRYRYYHLPFGGVQLLMIGDLHQLPPVVKNDEWELLQEHYKTPYFFGSLALQKTGVTTIELKHIYRQADQDFIGILNKVRNNKIDQEVMDALNSRYLPDFEPDEKDSFITLSSHNASAKRINDGKLKALPGKTHSFSAKIDGDFPEHAFPTEEELVFKIDAQVMFVKNDLSEDKRYYNGKIGKIVRITSNLITVRCPEDERDILVKPVEWHNRKYELDSETKEVKEKLIGTFVQHPLKLAWAITIHKSQGLTFDKVIIDAQAAFAHGQVYVALSRCKTFEGIVLQSQLYSSSIKTDTVVRNYTEDAERNAPDEAQLTQAKKEYQQQLLRDYFQFKLLKTRLNQFRQTVIDGEKSLHGNIENDTNALIQKAQDKVLAVGQAFQRQLAGYLAQELIPEENIELNERLKKAGKYFTEVLENELLLELNRIEILTDNQEVRKKTKERRENLQKEIFLSAVRAKSFLEGFNSHRFTKMAVDAELDFKPSKSKKKPSKSKASANAEHPELFHILSQWRWEECQERDVPAYQILTTRSILELVSVLPTNPTNLKRIHGIGKSKINTFGNAIIEMIVRFAEENMLETDNLKLASGKAPKPPKKDTREVSYELFQKGKDLHEIAQERSLTPATIEKHLTHYVGLGKIDVNDVLKPAVVSEILAYFTQAQSSSLKKAHDFFRGKYGYGELGMVRASLSGEE